jgi:hypothetical protein
MANVSELDLGARHSGQWPPVGCTQLVTTIGPAPAQLRLGRTETGSSAERQPTH